MNIFLIMDNNVLYCFNKLLSRVFWRNDLSSWDGILRHQKYPRVYCEDLIQVCHKEVRRKRGYFNP